MVRPPFTQSTCPAVTPYLQTFRFVSFAAAVLSRQNPVDGVEFVGRERRVLQCSEIFFDLGNLARADQRAGDHWIAEHPHERQLGERLPAGAGERVELADFAELFRGDM